jgi:hypothetical protein
MGLGGKTSKCAFVLKGLFFYTEILSDTKVLFTSTLLVTAGRRDNMKYGRVTLCVARGLNL